ncbi:ephrin type-B receptor 1-B isoform X2 [Agrilus planipennis]|uniref:receptor protein-tyrosine kinase n=1 Tax=Agrilus planipennis TaxID=224129 RepID=A0A1W4X8H2_AGRPL|nr:ephrin type-B receptor 1-B isoform X2 [Agrilus planipennis]
MGLIPRFLPLLAILTHYKINCEQVVLLDTTSEEKLEWTRFPYGPQATTPGWVEESFTDFVKGINWRSYVVCDVAYDNVNNWLWTPFIDRGVANRIYIEIKFTIRDCSLFPGNALSCKETFSLLYYEFDAATREPPPWETDSYKLVARIAAGEGRFNSNSEVNINSEVRSIPVTKKGVYIAFMDQGACISLLAIKIYYITCPETTINFAHFNATPTGKEATVIVLAKGVCVKNAEVDDIAPSYVCKGDGKWSLPTGGCKCKAGFQPDVEKQACNICPIGKYKDKAGDGECKSCPEYSKAIKNGSVECKCNDGYFRAPKDPKDMPCTQPPSAPQNLTLNFVDQSMVTLSWSPPQYLGGRTDIYYRIKCDACSSGAVQYIPSAEIFNDTRVTISGLNALTSYGFQVYAENGVSHLSSAKTPPKFANIVVTTEASVANSIPNVRVTSVKSTEIGLAWDAPSFDGNDHEPVELYEVRYSARGDADYSNVSSIYTSEQSTTITGLQQRTEYGIQVRAKSHKGWGNYSPVILKTTGQVLNTGDEEGLHLRFMAGGIVVIVVILVAVIVLTVVFLRSRANDECNKKQPSDCDTLEYRNGEVHHSLDNPPIVTTHTNVTTPLFAPIGGASRTYIDPHTYEDPNQAVREFAREIDASCITIEAIIGGGEFGDVCKGKLKISSNNEIDVAIKTLKAGSHEKARNDFLTEASIMGQFEHPNVIFLQGVVTKSNPVMIITEYMENGSLDTFLRANDGKFQVLQLVGMLRGIASGMQYLSEMNYVHRDLAARNVLVNSQLVCKIADFGLSREIESATEGAYTTRGGKIPVRWTAPEAIAFRKFTSASDVWSMGIVCWEVMSYGERPYWNWSNQDVIKSIEKGYRLPAPMDCPEAIYQLMLDCWQKERTHRPSFQSIVKTLDKLIRVPDTLRKIAQNRRQPPLNPYFWPNSKLVNEMQDVSLAQLPPSSIFPNQNYGDFPTFGTFFVPLEPVARPDFRPSSGGSLLQLCPPIYTTSSSSNFLNNFTTNICDDQSSSGTRNWLENNLNNGGGFKFDNFRFSDMSREENNEDLVGGGNGEWGRETGGQEDTVTSQWSSTDTENCAKTGAWVNFNNLSNNPLAADAPDLTNFTSVEEWLNSIKMTRYVDNFHTGGINTMEAVVNLTVKDLTELGITLVGHQKKIMNSVQSIRAQIRVNGPEGFLV